MPMLSWQMARYQLKSAAQIYDYDIYTKMHNEGQASVERALRTAGVKFIQISTKDLSKPETAATLSNFMQLNGVVPLPHSNRRSPAPSQSSEGGVHAELAAWLKQRPSRSLRATRFMYLLVARSLKEAMPVASKISEHDHLGSPRPLLDIASYRAYQKIDPLRKRLTVNAYLATMIRRAQSTKGSFGAVITAARYEQWQSAGVDLLQLGFHEVIAIEPEQGTPPTDTSAAAGSQRPLSSTFPDAITHRVTLSAEGSASEEAIRALVGRLSGLLEQQTPTKGSIPVETSPDAFRIWAFSDPHVGSDIAHGRESLSYAIHHAEYGSPNTAAFSWDIGLALGDFSGAQGPPKDWEGREVVRQLGAMNRHKREDVYTLCGNHDRNALHDPEGKWFRKWLDPMGHSTEFSGVDSTRRPYPTEGRWDRYSFRVGNLLFLMMSDVNESSQTFGRGDLGGNPGGVVTGETFEWWKSMVEANPDSIIITAHHYVLKNTTVASGDWEGFITDEAGHMKWHFHGYKDQGEPRGASYLYWVGHKKDSGAFESFLQKNPGSSAMWLAGHTHAPPNDTTGGKSHIETRWGCHFVNVCALTAFHGKPQLCIPISRRLTFFEGKDEVLIECYLHTDQVQKTGWYPERTVRLKLPRAFHREPPASKTS